MALLKNDKQGGREIGDYINIKLLELKILAKIVTEHFQPVVKTVGTGADCEGLNNSAQPARSKRA